MRKKLLLSSVFGPYGVDDEFGRKENIMELFHNQVTREQGVFSLRMNHPSGGLHLIAENLKTPTVVLDFPDLDRFIEEIKKGYDYVGISFIVPNFIKAREMCLLIRMHAPKTKIILGGHGTSIPGIEKKVFCDHFCKGDGISFMRNLLGEKIDGPIGHPTALHATVEKHIMGVSTKADTGLIFPGVGCVNACRFCCTTHFFEKAYTPYLKTGKEMYEVLLEMERRIGITDFFIMDENFLKDDKRAKDLLSLMEKNNKHYSFGIFSSAETVVKLGPDFLERLGVRLIWIGLESKKDLFVKNKGIDPKALIEELRQHGISVLASGILFLEHHDKESLQDDIDFMVGMNADFVQFMQLGPLPGTELFDTYCKEGKLLLDIPYEEWHGQKEIWFKHSHFTGSQSEKLLKEAFKLDYKTNGPTLLRMLNTAIIGVINLSKKNYSDDYMKGRLNQREKWALSLLPLLPSLIVASHKRGLAMHILFQYIGYFGIKLSVPFLKSTVVGGLFFKEVVRNVFVENNMRQPKTVVTNFRC